MSKQLSEDQVQLLREKHLGFVATVMPDGSPQVTPVWLDTDGRDVFFNTARGRVKEKNLKRNPRVAVSVIDPEKAYERVLVLQGTAEMTEEGADAHIDSLAKKYLGQDSYPFRRPDEVRVKVRITPDKVM